MKGGYYRYNFPSFDLVFLGLNTMFFKKEVCDTAGASEMLDWLENIFEKNMRI
jgi:hypothetical protein